ncbi:MAG: FtsQ-type POTRA domain-containing protein [Caldilineaceae bacterium]|nr:FtsQ-type POTRA domain-containing protein [Caldilineaceae bacterium]
MNSQPVLRTSASGSPRGSRQKPAQQPSQKPSPNRSPGRSKSTLPNPYHQARRKRAASRQKRRFEAVFARIPMPTDLGSHLQGLEMPAVLQPTPWSLSKALSLLLVVGALTSLFMLHTAEEWFVYREDVRFHNLIRLRGDDLYQIADLDGWNIFWLEPEAIRARLLALPWVEDAQVAVSLPATVAVNVIEMPPAAVWVTNAGNYWLAANGAALPVATLEESALPELALPQIIDSLQEARVIGDGPLAIDPQILTSALALVEAMPELDGIIRYNKSIGLNFPLPDPAVWVYWGDGFDMESKLENLSVSRDLIRNAEEPAQILDVRFIDRPYVR